MFIVIIVIIVFIEVIVIALLFHKLLGLKNSGSICYANSVLQQLFMIPEFRDGILSAKMVIQDNNNDQQQLTLEVAPILFELQKMFCYLKVCIVMIA